MFCDSTVDVGGGLKKYYTNLWNTLLYFPWPLLNQKIWSVVEVVDAEECDRDLPSGINPFEDDSLLAGTALVASEDFASWASTSETIVVEALRAPQFEFVVENVLHVCVLIVGIKIRCELSNGSSHVLSPSQKDDSIVFGSWYNSWASPRTFCLVFDFVITLVRVWEEGVGVVAKDVLFNCALVNEVEVVAAEDVLPELRLSQCSWSWCWWRLTQLRLSHLNLSCHQRCLTHLHLGQGSWRWWRLTTLRLSPLN